MEELLPPSKSSKSDELSSVISFTNQSVKNLRETDFDLSSKELIKLNQEECILILFYIDNTESKNLAKIWIEAAAQISGPIFAACNMNIERKVAEAFVKINNNPDHPFNWAGLKQYPFILVYRSGWPKGFYNGSRTVEAIMDYSLTLACVVMYEEHKQLHQGVQPENNYEMPGLSSEPKIRTSSDEYKSTNPLRGYDPRIPIYIKGSKQEKKNEEPKSEVPEIKGEEKQTTPEIAETRNRGPINLEEKE